MQKRATVDAMARGEKDEYGRWAFDARRELGLSADWVADELGVHRTTIVRAEGLQRTPELARELARLLVAQAREKAVILPPPPGQPAPAQPPASSDLATLVQLVTAQQAQIVALTEAVRDLTHAIATDRQGPPWLDDAVPAAARYIVNGLRGRATEP